MMFRERPIPSVPRRSSLVPLPSLPVNPAGPRNLPDVDANFAYPGPVWMATASRLAPFFAAVPRRVDTTACHWSPVTSAPSAVRCGPSSVGTGPSPAGFRPASAGMSSLLVVSCRSAMSRTRLPSPPTPAAKAASCGGSSMEGSMILATPRSMETPRTYCACRRGVIRSNICQLASRSLRSRSSFMLIGPKRPPGQHPPANYARNLAKYNPAAQDRRRSGGAGSRPAGLRRGQPFANPFPNRPLHSAAGAVL